MDRYIVAAHINSSLKHAILDDKFSRKNLNSHKKSWYATNLCETHKVYKKSPTLKELVYTKQDYDKLNNQKPVEGLTFTTEWADSEAADIYNVCQKCTQIISLAERFNMPHTLVHYFLSQGIELDNWGDTVSQLKFLNLTKKDIKKLTSYTIPVPDWVVFVTTRKRNSIDHKRAYLLYINKYDYDRWPEMKNWPAEWIESYVG